MILPLHNNFTTTLAVLHHVAVFLLRSDFTTIYGDTSNADNTKSTKQNDKTATLFGYSAKRKCFSGV